jgi:hypothetical protein
MLNKFDCVVPPAPMALTLNSKISLAPADIIPEIVPFDARVKLGGRLPLAMEYEVVLEADTVVEKDDPTRPKVPRDVVLHTGAGVGAEPDGITIVADAEPISVPIDTFRVKL